MIDLISKHKTIGRRWNGCEYLGIITDDFVFNDKCKMCGENYGDDASIIVSNI